MATDAGLLPAVIEAQFLAASAGADRIIETPGFSIHLWTTPDPFYRHVAVPTARPASWRSAIAPMLAVFEHHRCRPALEYLAERWPRLGPALEEAGLACERRSTAMVCDALAAAPASASWAQWRVRHLSGTTPPPVLGAYLAALHAAFDERFPPEGSEPDALSLQRAMAEGRTLLAVVEDQGGQPIAGGGLIGIGRVGGLAAPVGELAGVWTAKAARGRGLARAVTAALLQRFFGHGGGLVWLAADDALAGGLYPGLGFRPIGRHLRYSRDGA
jgi:ribosomal protein S18 acetylase RimI-like enzyme